MKLTRACMDDLGALLDLDETTVRYDDRLALMQLVGEFKARYGIDWVAAKKAADKYAREWRRRHV